MITQEVRHTLSTRQYEKAQKIWADIQRLDFALKNLVLDWVEDAGLPSGDNAQYTFSEDRKELIGRVLIQTAPGMPSDTNQPMSDVFPGGGPPVSPVPAH